MWVLSFVVKKALLGNVKVMFVHFFLEAWNKGKDALRLFLLLALKML